MLLFHFLAVLAASQCLLFTAGAMPAPCSGGTVALTVTTPAELQSMLSVMNCTGKGTFDVVWTGTVPLLQVIEVSQTKQLTVTGSSGALADPLSDVMDAGRATGIFRVSNGSTLILNSMVLDGGTSLEGAAIDARDHSFVRVVGCTFTNNNATDGGAIYADTAEIQIDGDTVFIDNSAQLDGGAIFATESELYVDGNTTFANNSAGNDGGAVFCLQSNLSVDGYSSFTNTKAGHRGGGLYSSASRIYLSGVSHSRYNSAQDSGGAIFSLKSKLYVEGSFSFANNTAVERGGAVSAIGSEAYFNGTTLFTHNAAGDKGGAVSWVSSESSMDGETTFERNTALGRGGAMFAGNSNIRIDGQTWFGYNSAQLSGGGIQIHTSSLYIGGYTTFTHNSAGEDGGALMSYSELAIEITGTAIFSYNSAVWRGGAIVLTVSELRIRGNSSFMHNTAYDGGAIAVQQTPVYIDGSTRFVGNSAGHDGELAGTSLVTERQPRCITPRRTMAGAMIILGSNATITGELEMLSNTAFNGGGVYSALSPSFQVVGNISFSRNQATFYGGAISMTDPAEFRIVGVTFESNRGTSGGAVYLASTVGTTGGFKRCRFDGNEGTDGGALYVDTGDSGETQNTTFVQDSVFLHNAAVASGGALFNAGGLDISDTVFSANTAGDAGLAVHDEVSLGLLSNVTFHDNMFSCASGQYSDAHHDSGGTCRLALVCEQCAQGCEVNKGGGKVTTDTIPVCEDIPKGVSQSSETSLATFDLLAGYYRVSAESRIIRECYQQEACRGGTDHLNYCAIGYTGAYCAVCDVGYAPGVTNRCHECSEENRRWSVGLASAAGVVALLAAIFVLSHLLRDSEDESTSACPSFVYSWYKWLVKGLPLSAIKIIVVVLQIITQVCVCRRRIERREPALSLAIYSDIGTEFTEIAGAVYPEEYEAFLSKMSAINLDIGFLLSNSCIVTTDFYARLLFATIWPLVVLSVLFGTLFVARKRKRNDQNSEAMMQHKRASTGLFILFFVYSSVSFTIFQTFVCDELDDGESYLRADYSLLCTSDTYAAYEAYAAVMVCIYPIGIPAFFAWWLARNRNDLQKQGRDGLAHLQSSRGLWDAYSPSCYYFEVVECFRRIGLTGAAAFVLPNSAEQIAIIFLLAVVFTFISESLSPFASKADMWLYRWGNAIILASMYVALLLKTQLTDEDSQASAVMTALLISANVFLMVTVVVQAFLLVRGVYMARRMESAAPVASSRSFSSFALAAVAHEPVG